MHVRFHGVRGSIASPGPHTVRYGGNTVCVSVRTADDSLIVLDAGTGIRELGRQLLAEPKLPETIHLFITHAHWDHLIGAPFFGPLWRKDAHIVMHALSALTHERLQKEVLFDGEHFPVQRHELPCRLELPGFSGETVRIGSARVSRVALNHPGGADGFRIDDGDGTSLCYLTDNELNPPSSVAVRSTVEELARFAHGTDLLIHDAQYLPSDMPEKRGFGHSLVEEVMDLGRRAEARSVVLHHHDPERTDDMLDEVAAEADAWALDRAPTMKVRVAAEGQRYDLRPR